VGSNAKDESFDMSDRGTPVGATTATEYQELWSQCELRKAELEERNRQIDALLDSSPAGILLLDAERRILRANSEFRRVLGLESRTLEGMPIEELTEHLRSHLGPPSTAEVLVGALLGQPAPAEAAITIPTPRTVLVQQRAVEDATGRQVGAVVVLEDISENARMRRELEELAQFPLTNPFPVVCLCGDGRFSHANPAARPFLEELGVRDEKIELLLPTNYRELLQNTLETRAPLTNVQVDTMGRILQLTFRPFPGRDEVFLMIVDVTEKHRAQELIQKHAQELEEAYTALRNAQAQLIQSAKMATLGTLSAGIAHEVNTPVGAISSGIETLGLIGRKISAILVKLGPKMEQREQEELARLLRVLNEITGANSAACARITKIVRSLKAFAGLDEAPLKTVDLHEELDGTLTLLHNELKTRIEVAREYGRLPRVECLASQINQVFMNLLTNAIHAIPDKGTIRIRTQSEGEAVRISISDTGRGIPPEKLERLFEPTFTHQGARVGAGLGLSICQKIVEEHQGRILVESTPGKGSTFTVVLPVKFPQPSTRPKKDEVIARLGDSAPR
jgi:PAS domain S-box-containing protein